MSEQLYSVADLVPHSGKMSLLSTIESYTDSSLTASVLITKDSMFADSDGVPAWVGIEYMAQAIGAYAGLQQRNLGQAPKLGFLLGSRKYQCDAPVFSLGSKLIIVAERELMAENGLSVFKCRLSAPGVNASAQLNVYQPEDAELFLKGENNE